MTVHAGYRRYLSTRWNYVLATVLLLNGLLCIFVVSRIYTFQIAWTHATHHDSALEDKDNNVLIPLYPEQHISRPSRTIHLHWNISKSIRRPDGVAKEVYLINEKFPGPVIEARSGDEIFVTVQNSLSATEDAVSMHWHGLGVRNSMDGVANVTECPVMPGKTSTYHIEIPNDQAGTFWYHSHSGLQRADGLYGAIVVHEPRSRSSADVNEYLLMIGDWYHRTSEEVSAYYKDWKNYKIEPVADSMLLNGRGGFNCSMAVPARPLDCLHLDTPQLAFKGGRSRIRIANTGALLGFSIATESGAFQVITNDGGNIVQSSNWAKSVGILYPGERIDVLMELSETSQDILVISFDQKMITFPNLALTATQRFAVVADGPTDHKGSKNVAEYMDLTTLQGSKVDIPKADRAILLYTEVAYMASLGNIPHGRINRTSFEWELDPNQPQPLLASDVPQSSRQLQVSVIQDQWIDLIINNVDDRDHPFHLHGHDFYVLQWHTASRVGAHELYNPFQGGPAPGGALNLVNPRKKDTVVVPSMGYVVLRFQATRPGIWILHCHVLWHESVGMAMAIRVDDRGDGSLSVLREEAMRNCRPAI